MTELNRQAIHQEDQNRIAEIKELSLATQASLNSHIENYRQSEKSNEKFRNDMQPLITPMQNIVKRENDQQAASRWMVRIGRTIGFVAVVLTSIGVIFGAAWGIIELIIRLRK